MTIYVHPNRLSGTNSYLLGPDGPGAAIIVDPGSFDGPLLRHIEDHGYRLSHILVTRPRTFHISGIRTIRRIYDAEIVAPCDALLSFPCRRIGGDARIDIGGFRVETIAMPDHSHESVVYLINGILFGGDVLSAGLIDISASPYGRALLAKTIRDSIFTLPPETVIFSSFGPPTTVAVEHASSPDCRLDLSAERQ